MEFANTITTRFAQDHRCLHHEIDALEARPEDLRAALEEIVTPVSSSFAQSISTRKAYRFWPKESQNTG